MQTRPFGQATFEEHMADQAQITAEYEERQRADAIERAMAGRRRHQTALDRAKAILDEIGA